VTNLAISSPPHRLTRARLGVPATIALGALGGCALGIVARGWMRLISDDPEFSWSGTIFIVVGFTVFGFGQSIVAAARPRVQRRRRLTVIRMVGVVTMLPLFVAAGAVMLPTVVGGGLAVARTDWRAGVRVACLVVAALPVVLVGSQLIDSFGWSLQSMCGFVLMIAVYATIVWATHFTLAPQPDGWRLSRRARVATAVGALAIVPMLVIANVGLG
jgi:hypothetical protein